MCIDTTARSLNADGMMGEKDSKDTINDMNIRNSVGTMGAAASTEDSVPMFQPPALWNKPYRFYSQFFLPRRGAFRPKGAAWALEERDWIFQCWAIPEDIWTGGLSETWV